MPNYYYVRTHADGTGTATGSGGRYASLQTGDWDTTFTATTEYYSDIEYVLESATAPVDGDYIICSDIHTYTEVLSATRVWTIPSNIRLYCISVDDTAMETGKAGASETYTGSYNLTLSGSSIFVTEGVSLSVYGIMSLSVAAQWIARDATLSLTAPSGQWIGSTQDGCHLELHNVIIDYNTAVIGLLVYGGASVVWIGGSTTGTICTSIISGSAFANGGGSILVDGVDFSNNTTAGYLLAAGTGGNRADDDAIDITIKNCELGVAPLGFASEDFDSINQRMTVTNTASTSAEAEYQHFIQAFGGELEHDTSTWRRESVPYPSGTFVSACCTLTGNVCEGAPFVVELATRSVDLTAYSEIRIYTASTTELTQELVHAAVIYPDDPTYNQANYKSSKPANWLSSGTALATDSLSDWRDGTQPEGDAIGGTYYKQYISIDTSGDAGAEGVPHILLSFGEAAGTIIFVCPTIGLI